MAGGVRHSDLSRRRLSPPRWGVDGKNSGELVDDSVRTRGDAIPYKEVVGVYGTIQARVHWNAHHHQATHHAWIVPRSRRRRVP